MYQQACPSSPTIPVIYNRRSSDRVGQEIGVLASDLIRRHGDKTANIACLLHLTRSLLRGFAAANNTNLSHLLDLHRDCVLAWMAQHDVSKPSVLAALADLTRAGETVGYLDSLPD